MTTITANEGSRIKLPSLLFSPWPLFSYFWLLIPVSSTRPQVSLIRHHESAIILNVDNAY